MLTFKTFDPDHESKIKLRKILKNNKVKFYIDKILRDKIKKKYNKKETKTKEITIKKIKTKFDIKNLKLNVER